MRILVVGAGAIGGYFGGRLLQAGRDVTFLVRERRAAQLRRTGLLIRSPTGDFHAPAPPLVAAGELRPEFDLILLSCKAYDLPSAMESFAPAVGAGTMILPLLNGMRHLDELEASFGAAAVLGGQCTISATLDAQGSIVHLNEMHGLTYGERAGGRSARVDALQRQVFAGAPFDGRLSESILQSMWEKWVFIASLAGITCLMRASIGDIVAAGGSQWTAQILDECVRIATEAGFPPSQPVREFSSTILSGPGSSLTASMLRDVESHGRTEGDHILGDLLRRWKSLPPAGASVLAAAHLHLKAYEERRERESRHAS